MLMTFVPFIYCQRWICVVVMILHVCELRRWLPFRRACIASLRFIGRRLSRRYPCKAVSETRMLLLLHVAVPMTMCGQQTPFCPVARRQWRRTSVGTSWANRTHRTSARHCPACPSTVVEHVSLWAETVVRGDNQDEEEREKKHLAHWRRRCGHLRGRKATEWRRRFFRRRNRTPV